ncbi:ABC transporter permease [Salisediminibacterium halotolerans]|uniref:NitT/TauT family transport system permease protein n=1 Tax=Salisediminibacterium halotolerans TaxID=517425 RepID=A0A1H9U9V3_9BACI|nr:ABC transporter permease [Salisediminibacterium haloalkalitolerans]SES06018.1 NitT/TauT family transport system permease protein [Salisediminibacterium haloalkalitolerans]
MTVWQRTVYIFAAAAVVLTVWQSAVWIGDYPEALLPSPALAFAGFMEMVRDGTMAEHIGVSLYRFAAGYTSAVIAAVILGLLLAQSVHVWRVVDPIVQVLRPVAPVAWSPFIVLWFGIGSAPAIVIIFIAAFFPVLLSTVAAVRRIDKTYLKLASNLEVSRTSRMFKIIFPAAFPGIANGLHIAVGTAWIFLVAGEMIGAQSGLGYLIVDARNALDLDHVLAGIFTIGILGLLLDKAVGWGESWIGRQWGVER